MFAYAVIPVFESCSVWITEGRAKDKNIFTHFESLYRQLLEIELSNGGCNSGNDPAEFEKYWTSEKQAKPGSPLPGRTVKVGTAAAGKL
jgi:hypothetical protein